MDFSIPREFSDDVARFKLFLEKQVTPHLSDWYQQKSMPRGFFESMAKGGWFNFTFKNGKLSKLSALRSALIGEQLAMVSPGIAVARLAHADLGLTGLWLFGSETLHNKYVESVVKGETLMCIGNTENVAGSDVANITSQAQKVEGGWVLNGTKGYVTNGAIADMALITAVSDPQAPRNRRISMYFVDLNTKGVTREKLNKQVWIPSDLTRVQLNDVFVPEDHLFGASERGLQQVLTIFTHSRVPLSAMTLGTATGAFELAFQRAREHKLFGKKIIDFQAKAFELADFYARIEAARLMLWKACWAIDKGKDFRLESSLAKYLSVLIAREVTTWAADLFGAASVIFDHPVHKFPMDAWASSLGEGTQDVQKLVIFRELMQRDMLF
jgi:alkylation response protein AidB-like acyl-CoA dehydrogenase